MHELQSVIAQAQNQLLHAVLGDIILHRLQRLHTDDAISTLADNLLQKLGCPFGAAINRKIEDGIIQTGGQVVVADDVGILRAVNLMHLLHGDVLDALLRQPLALAIGVVSSPGDAVVRLAAAVVRVIDVAALVSNQQSKGFVVGVSHLPSGQ